MEAAVSTGYSTMDVRSGPVPEIGLGEILIKVHSCGVCHTDLKKIAYNLLPPPRIYGHETAGEVAAGGRRATRSEGSVPGPVVHSIPCMESFYFPPKLYPHFPVT